VLANEDGRRETGRAAALKTRTALRQAKPEPHAPSTPKRQLAALARAAAEPGSFEEF
jgi:hypothetical protein